MSDGKIRGPATGLDDYSYQVSCQQALFPAIQQIHQRAVKAGWDARAVHYALMVLAAANLRNREAEPEGGPESVEESP